jgi:FkbM family methyltransferase
MTTTAAKYWFQCSVCGVGFFTKQIKITCCNVVHKLGQVGFYDPHRSNRTVVKSNGPVINPIKHPCVHLGKSTGSQVCPSCAGHVEIKIFECGVYGECTLGQSIGKACCSNNCQSYTPRLDTKRVSELLLSDIEEPFKQREPGWEHDLQVAATHKQLINKVVSDVTNRTMPLDHKGRGIVVLGGGSKYFACAYILVTLLRRQGCTLPIEWWYLNHSEMDLQMMRLAESLGGVEVVNLNHRLDSAERKPRMMGGWQAKVWSIMYSKFDEVLFLDADQIPQADPTYLFDSKQYLENGAVFWPDFAPMGWSITATAFDVAGLPVPGKKAKPGWSCPTDYIPFESGQILINKRRHWPALELARHINDHSDFWYADSARDRHKWHVYGDKDTFYLAFNRINAPYAMPQACGFSGNSETAGAFLQHDFEGKVLFHHRVQPTGKWSLHGHNHSYPACDKHDECQQILNKLRKLWVGHPYDHSYETETEHDLAIRARGRKLWFREKQGQREIELLPQGQTSDGRYHWTIRLFDGKPTLIIADWCKVLAMLGEDPYGNWVNHASKNFLVAAPPVGFDLPQKPDEVTLWHEIVNLNEYKLPDRFEPDDVILDIGAHCGIFTTMCLERGAGRVIGVEPHPDNLQRLRHNMKDFSDRVILVPAAAWRCGVSPGHVFIAQHPGAMHSGGWSAIGTKQGLSVHTVPFDVVVKLAAPIRLVKLDCEGSEWGILETFNDWHLVKAWCGEYHHNKLSEAKARLTAIFSPHYKNIDVQPNENSDLLGHFWAW